jgi:iron-sulfur cluster repair protein YtfE (RIC family)
MTIDPTLSVNELLRRYPAALPILAAAGIDSCCGGEQSLALAAARSGLTFDQLAARLQDGVARRGLDNRTPACGCGCGRRVG